ncbi:hypothetical protein BpHYR1_015807 [Brachionus plicatilis]|uniref:Uncharacterized protein n=1 Tax=Brachionus plicatilis TaxID=10195 RepID=A0A3M7PNX3_BRAPC|nr:hypothetical protein BpHYR1_015807 [Brachionus plicatilis]
MNKKSIHLMSQKLRSPVTHLPLYIPISTALAAIEIDRLITAALSKYLPSSCDVRAFRDGRSASKLITFTVVGRGKAKI